MNPSENPIFNQPLEPISLTMSQRFEQERMLRTLDSCNDVESLRSLSKQLVEAWMTQKAMISWLMRQQLGIRDVK